MNLPVQAVDVRPLGPLGPNAGVAELADVGDSKAFFKREHEYQSDRDEILG